MPTVEELKAVITADTSGLDAGVASAGRKLDDFGEGAGKASKATLDFGDAGKLAEKALGAFGVTLGATELIRFGADALRAANDLDKTEATVRALSGSQERYNEVLALAEQGQQRYGGSLNENLSGLGSLVNLSNRSSVELSQLDNIARRLALVDPLQGIEGATVALKEFLTGSDATAIQSLVRRFELPKSALKDLTSETLTAEEKAQALAKVLDDVGITNEVLSNRTQTTAATYDKLGASFDNAKVTVGKWLADGLEPAAKGATVLFDAVAGKNQADAILNVADAYAQLSGKLGGLSDEEKRLGELTLARLGFQTDAAAMAQAQSEALERILLSTGARNAPRFIDPEARKDIEELLPRLGQLAASSKETGDQVRALAEEYRRTGDLDKFRTAIGFLDQAQRDAGRSADESTPGYIKMHQALAATAQAAQLSSDDLEKLEQKLTKTAETGEAASERLRDAEQKYADDTQRRREDLGRRLEEIQRDSAQKLADLDRETADRRTEIEQTLQDRVADLQREGNERLQNEQARYQDQEAQAAERHAQKLQDLQQRLADTTAQAQADITQAQQDAAQKLQDLQQRAADGRTDREQDHNDRLADLQTRRDQASTDAERTRIDVQIDQLNREYAQREERAARDEARQQAQLERDRQRAEAAAAERLAKQQAQLQAEIQAEQEAEAKRAAVAAAAAEKQRADTIAEYTRRTADAQAQHDKAIAQLEQRYARERETQTRATAQKLADAQADYAREEQQRAAAFARQEQQLKESLGKQLQEYTRIQQQMSQISDQEAARRLANIQREYGVSPDRGAGAFGALAAGAGITPGQQAAAADAFGALSGLGIRLPGAAGALQSALTVQAPINVYGVTDPQAVALLVRDELLRIARQNGGTGIT